MVSYDSVCVYWKWPKRYQRMQVILVLASCFLVHLSIGTLYTYGNLVPYIVSYVRERSGPETLRFTDTPYVYACQIAGQGSSMIVGGLLERRFGPRLITLFGGLLMSSGVALSYLTIQYSFWLMLLTYGVMFGLGIGLAYVGPLACAMRWLPKWKGVASGIVVSGFGLSALIFNTVQTEYINPDNLSPDLPDPDNAEIKYFSQKSILDRVPSVFLLLAGCYSVMQIVGSIFIVNPPPSDDSKHKEGDSIEEKTQPRENYEISKRDCDNSSDRKSGILDSTSLKGSIHSISAEEDDDEEEQRDYSSDTDYLLMSNKTSSFPRPSVSVNSSIASTDVKLPSFNKITPNYALNLTPLKMLGKLNFYVLWIMFFLSGTSVTFISSLYKSFGLEKVTSDDHVLSIVGGVSAIFNLLGRLVWGGVADVTTYKVAFVLQGALMTCLLLTLYSTVTRSAAFFVWMCGIYFCVGGYFSLFPVATARLFGQDNVSVNYGILFTSQIFGGLLAGLISQFLVDHIFWYGMFFFIAALSGVEFVLALLYRHKRYLLLPSPSDLLESVSRIEESTIKFPDDSSLKLPDYD